MTRTNSQRARSQSARSQRSTLHGTAPRGPAPRGTQSAGNARPRGLSNGAFKLWAVCLALPAVCATAFVTRQQSMSASPADWSVGTMTQVILVEALAWVSVPIVTWLMVEGHRHTSSQLFYALRLLLLAGACEPLYDRLLSGRFVDLSSQNPLFAVVLALFMLQVLQAVGCLPAAGDMASFILRSAPDGPDAQEHGQDQDPGQRGRLTRRPGTALRIVLTAGVALGAIFWVAVLRLGTVHRILPLGILIVLLALVFALLRQHENTKMYLAAIIGACFGITPAFGVAIVHYANGTLGYSPSKRWVYYLVPLVILVAAQLAI